jgi:hypothetical protein
MPAREQWKRAHPPGRRRWAVLGFGTLVAVGVVLFAVRALTAGSGSPDGNRAASDPAGAATAAASGMRFVAPSGSNTSPCTEAQPCRTFNRAYRVAGAGDIVQVEGGVYPHQTIGRDRSKTSGEDIVFQPVPGADVVVRCDTGGRECLNIEGSHITVRDMRTATLARRGGFRNQGAITIGREGAHDVTLEHVDFGAAFIAANGVTIRDSDIGPAVDNNIRVATTCLNHRAVRCLPRNLVLADNRIHHFAMYRDHQECLAIDVGDGVRILRNRFDTCAVFSIFAAPERGDVLRNVVIENNFFTNTGHYGMSTHVKISSHGGACRNVLVRNNSFLGDDVIADCHVRGRARGIRFVSNLFGSHFRCGSSRGSSWRFNVFLAGSSACGTGWAKVPSAGFVHAAAGDLHLTPGSPVIDRVTPNAWPAVDIDGDSRPLGNRADAGADEAG